MSIARDVKMIDSFDWDELVRKTYGRPYCFQQQDDCKPRGIHHITIPTDATEEDDNETWPDEIPEVINGEEMGVNFKSWLKRDPNQKLPGRDDQDDFSLDLFWTRNFYPDIDMIANDLHKRGLIEAGDYIINIDW